MNKLPPQMNVSDQLGVSRFSDTIKLIRKPESGELYLQIRLKNSANRPYLIDQIQAHLDIYEEYFGEEEEDG